MLEINLSKENSFLRNSNIINIKKDSKYKISTEIINFKSEPFSAYFGIIEVDKNNKEVRRIIKWLNGKSNVKKTINLVFKSKKDRIILIYRINTETPINSDCKINVLQIDEISISQEESLLEDYDDLNDFQLPRPEELTQDQESIFEENLVWVFSSTRSGSTWLGTQLLSFKTHIMNEPHISSHLDFPEPGITDSIVRTVDNRKNYKSYFFAKQFEKTWLFYLRKLILNRIYSQFRDLSKEIIIKEPVIIGAVDIISKCFPNSKIIILIRDGRDIIDSQIDARRNDESWATKVGMTKLDPKKRLNFIENHSRYWVEIVNHLTNSIKKHPKQNQLFVRYEDLRKSTPEVLNKIYEFLQIEISESEIKEIVEKYSFENIPSNLKGSGKFTRFARPGLWKENFSSEEKSVMGEIMNKTLEELEYEL